MDDAKKLRTHKADLNLVRGGIICLSVILAGWNVGAYFIASDEYQIGTMGVLSAVIFILLVEISKTYGKSTFAIGLYISNGILILFILTLKDKFKLFTADNLFYVGIYFLLEIGNKLSAKVARWERVVAGMRASSD